MCFAHLRYIPRLQRLDLQDTGLVVLPNKIFLPTQNLQWLSLSNNAFENVPEGALSQAPVLESLDLSGNDFTSFGEHLRCLKVCSVVIKNGKYIPLTIKSSYISNTYRG